MPFSKQLFAGLDTPYVLDPRLFTAVLTSTPTFTPLIQPSYQNRQQLEVRSSLKQLFAGLDTPYALDTKLGIAILTSTLPIQSSYQSQQRFKVYYLDTTYGLDTKLFSKVRTS